MATKNSYMDRAEAIFGKGYNCAQAVLGAFAEAYGLDMDTAMRVASSLGGGLGHSGEVCGAALGMAVAIGLGKGYAEADPAVKMTHSALVKEMMDDFRLQFGATRCDALREVGNRALCVDYVRYAAALAAKHGGLCDATDA